MPRSIALLVTCQFDSPVCAISVSPDANFGPNQQMRWCPMCFDYIQGRGKPNYPPPAIAEHFEFGWSISDDQPVLIHVVSETYFATMACRDLKFIKENA